MPYRIPLQWEARTQRRKWRRTRKHTHCPPQTQTRIGVVWPRRFAVKIKSTVMKRKGRMRVRQEVLCWKLIRSQSPVCRRNAPILLQQSELSAVSGHFSSHRVWERRSLQSCFTASNPCNNLRFCNIGTGLSILSFMWCQTMAFFFGPLAGFVPEKYTLCFNCKIGHRSRGAQGSIIRLQTSGSVEAGMNVSAWIEVKQVKPRRWLPCTQFPGPQFHTGNYLVLCIFLPSDDRCVRLGSACAGL